MHLFNVKHLAQLAGSKMPDYPPNEIVNMIFVLGESQNNHRGTARLYAKCYPDRRHLDHRAIRLLTQRARGGHMIFSTKAPGI